MIATSIEQSKQLVRLGLVPSTADMYYPYLGAGQYGDIPRVGFPIEHSGGRDIPAWSLSALLDVMPSFVDYNEQKLRLTIEKAGIWNVFYLGTEHRLNEIWFNGEYGDPVEPAYKMVCWLLENNLIKKGSEQ